jgi:hypothetical protein
MICQFFADTTALTWWWGKKGEEEKKKKGRPFRFGQVVRVNPKSGFFLDDEFHQNSSLMMRLNGRGCAGSHPKHTKV